MHLEPQPETSGRTNFLISAARGKSVLIRGSQVLKRSTRWAMFWRMHLSIPRRPCQSNLHQDVG